MTLLESLATGLMAVVLGTLVAVPPLFGTALGISGQPLPSVTPVLYAAIAAGVVVLGVVSVMVPTRATLRTRPTP